jgi:hypothetical protein
MPDLACVTMLALLSTMPAVSHPAAVRQDASPFAMALRHPPAFSRTAQGPQSKPQRDSLKNGALIGLTVGAVSGLFLGAVGCGLAAGLSETGESSCTRPVLVGALVFGAVGAGIGAGIDALLERAPSIAGAPQGVRRGIRVRFRF